MQRYRSPARGKTRAVTREKKGTIFTGCNATVSPSLPPQAPSGEPRTIAIPVRLIINKTGREKERSV